MSQGEVAQETRCSRRCCTLVQGGAGLDGGGLPKRPVPAWRDTKLATLVNKMSTLYPQLLAQAGRSDKAIPVYRQALLCTESPNNATLEELQREFATAAWTPTLPRPHHETACTSPRTTPRRGSLIL